MPDRAPEPRGRTAHTITNVWTVAAMTCAGCGAWWEQPSYVEDGSTWVCPHCLHAAPAERARRG